MNPRPGDIVYRDGVKYRVLADGSLSPVEELLTKRFGHDDCEMTSGVRRAMEQHAS